ncbi:MAG: hypothetical protein ABI912_06260 [Actinomycetota bacterium]
MTADHSALQPADDAARLAAFMSALVTEHFALQGAASTTVTEAAGRSALYFSALSSSLVAMGFAAQSTRRFAPFAAAVIPTVIALGVLTAVRLVDTGVQNLTFLADIARIRGYYRSLLPDGSEYFRPWGGEQNEGDQALAAVSRKQGLLTGLGTAAAMVAAINAVVAGIGAALATMSLTGGNTTFAGVGGIVITLIFVSGFLVYQDHRYRTAASQRQG